MIHPENSDEMNSLISFVETSETVPVWCNGCGMERKMNAIYAPYVQDIGLQSCRFCRESDEQ
jgi:hypothetical protein